jgi:hypothetical protein
MSREAPPRIFQATEEPTDCTTGVLPLDEMDRLRERAVPTAPPGAGSLQGIPVLIRRLDVRTDTVNHRQAFLLSLVDGVSTVDTLAESSGLPSAEAVSTYRELIALGLLALA